MSNNSNRLVKIVLLPTNKETNLIIGSSYDHLINRKEKIVSPRGKFMYIGERTDYVENDWIFVDHDDIRFKDKPLQFIKLLPGEISLFKINGKEVLVSDEINQYNPRHIIFTNDPELIQNGVRAISESFIVKYVDKYNFDGIWINFDEESNEINFIEPPTRIKNER